MKTTGLVRRTLGNAVGCATLITLAIALIPVFHGTNVAVRNWPTVAGALMIFSVISYRVWLEFERIGTIWPMAVLISVGLGLASLLLDFLFGRMLHPDLGVIQSTVSTLPFWLTMFICPLGTVIILAGWARHIALGGNSTPHS